MDRDSQGSNTSFINDDEQQFNRLKAQLHEQLIGGMNLSLVRTVEPGWLREELRRGGGEELCQHHAGLLSQADRERLIDELVYEALGLGPLEPLMADPTISDILINGPHTIYVERRGKLERTSARFLDLDHLLNIVQRIAGRVGRRIDEASPMVDARLPDGSRVNRDHMRPLVLWTARTGFDSAVFRAAADGRRPRRPQVGRARHARFPRRLRQGAAQHHGLRRNRQRQDNAFEYAVRLYSRK